MPIKINGTNTAANPSITGADTDTGIVYGSDQIDFSIGGASKVTIDSSGNVGINDTSPTAELSVAATAPHIDIGAAGGTRMKIGYEGNNCFFGGTASTAMFIWKQNIDAEGHPQASGTERMRLNSDGLLGIGTTGATKVLEVSNTGKTNYSTCFMHCDGSDNVRVMGLRSDRASGGTSGQMIEFFNSSGSNVGQIASNGSSTSYNTSSDYRLKENATAISDGITRLKTLKPYRFNWKVDASTTVDGFLAHEVTAVPEAITGIKDQVATSDDVNDEIKEGDPIYQSIDQSKLVPLLTAALQEAIAKIEVLETKVAALEAA